MIVLIIITGVIICLILVVMAGWRRYYKYIDCYITARNNYRYKLTVCDMWLALYQKNARIGSLFHDKDIKEIAIYGTGMFGVRLYNELKEDKDIKIVCMINDPAEPDGQYDLRNLKTIKSPDELEDRDVTVIVTDPFNFYEKKDLLEKKGIKKIYSLDELLQEGICDSR